MKTVLILALTLLLSTFAAAQPPEGGRTATPAPDEPPALSIRPFVMGAFQAFSAVETFDAVFGAAHQPFFGGGVQVAFSRGFVVEAGASRFKETGERAFRSNGQNYSLGLPLTAEIRPFEITGGYRFRLRGLQHVVPYAAAGYGSYGYTETSPSSDPGENVDVRHSGFVVNGGAEFRLHRWIGVGLDVQYTHIPGILGNGGISKAAGESDLGGVAGRLKFIVGR